MPSTDEKKLEQMRAYNNTPAGRAARKRAHEKRLIKRGKTEKPIKINLLPLLNALAKWR